MLVSPGADRRVMLKYRYFDQSGKLGTWDLVSCNISKLPPSFGELVSNDNLIPAVLDKDNLSLTRNDLESLLDSFSEIRVAGILNLRGNPQLTGVPENFPNVRSVYFGASREIRELEAAAHLFT